MSKNRISGVMIAAPHSGSGKTVFSCTLMSILKSQGKNVVAYKCGPDYIDPMYHKKIIGVPSFNLDSYFLSEEQLLSYFTEKYVEQDGDLAVIEGVMGLYDGLGGIKEEGSAYHVASILNIPIVLVVDAKGMGASLIPLIAGFLSYDKKRLIKGVVLNRTTEAFYNQIKSRIEDELEIKVLGYICNDKSLCIESRHLGLKLPEENKSLKEDIVIAAEKISKTVDISELNNLVEKCSWVTDEESYIGGIDRNEVDKRNVKLAVAMDDAFCFYYEHNLDILNKLGVDIIYFSPLNDDKLPDGIDGILIGGGYPELYAKKLSENKAMLESIKTAIEQGIPSVAECGGFMYLHKTLIDEDGNSFDMVGAIDGNISYKGRLVRFGYIEIKDLNNCFISGDEIIKGHEFHYYDSDANGEGCEAIKPVSGKKWSCVHTDRNCWWGFPHIYYASNINFAKSFVKKMQEYAKI